MSESRIRICRTHPQVHPGGAMAACGGRFSTHPCDIVEMVWSSDRTALLAIGQCEDCDGEGKTIDAPFNDPTFNDEDRVPLAYLPEVPCPKCGGRGYTYRARVRSGTTQMAIAADSYNEGWSDALDARDTEKVAVVPL